jgi:cytoskeletal protein RodZ
MEDDDASEDTRRVRILSTLESTRQASRPGRTKGGRRTQKTKRSGWLQGALWGALGLGVVSLMAGFVMVIQDTKPALAHAAPPPATQLVKAKDAELPKPGTMPPPAAGPAVIETTATPPLPPQATTADNHAVAQAASATQPSHNKLETLLASNAPKPEHATARASDKADKEKTTTASIAPAPATTAAKSASKPASSNAKGQDEDVALLEAMFAHTGRKAAAKPAPSKN